MLPSDVCAHICSWLPPATRVFLPHWSRHIFCRSWAQGAPLHTICLIGVPLSPADVRVLAASAQVRQVRALHMHHNGCSLSPILWSTAMRARTLSLGNDAKQHGPAVSPPGNHLDLTPPPLLRAMPQVHALLLDSLNINDIHAQLLAAALATGGAPQLRTLCLHNNQMVHSAGDVIQSWTGRSCGTSQIISLEMGYNPHHPASIEQILRALVSQRHIRHLDLGNVGLRQGSAMINSLSASKFSLRHLILECNDLNVHEISLIVQLCCAGGFPALILLDLDDNDATMHEVRHLDHTLRHQCPQLEFYLSNGLR